MASSFASSFKPLTPLAWSSFVEAISFSVLMARSATGACLLGEVFVDVEFPPVIATISLAMADMRGSPSCTK